ncbi:unnamed protein product [Ilex paraguariensis]|uniref:Uncharacterized protein n=1 Tax=Ilex paraguariensis TaxID=185542 RepID=A0ABC8R3N3_9AQUA
MRRSSDYRPNNQYGWGTTSYEYHPPVPQIQRMPTLLPGVPQYPDVYMLFNNKVTYGEEQNQKKVPKSQKKVSFVEPEKTTEIDKVHEESMDEKADGFLQRAHQNFGLSRWATFKVS